MRLTLDQESEEEFRKGKIQILAELTKLRLSLFSMGVPVSASLNPAFTSFTALAACAIVQNQDERARKRLQKMIRPFVLRRLKKDVLTDLPDKLEENLYARLDRHSLVFADSPL